MTTSLVTGGAGFIGSHIAAYLIQRGDQVVVLDDLSGGFRENIPANALFYEGSVTDHHLVNQLFENYSFDYVYHLAAYAAEGLSHFIRRFNYSNNLIGSVNLINASVNSNVKCFVFTSSIAVYGENNLPHKEEQIPRPSDPYGLAKYAVELDLKSAYEMFGLNSIVFRLHNVYGSNQNIGDKYRNVVGIFMNQCLKNQPMTIFGDGLQSRAFTYVEDIVRTLADCVFNSKAFNQTFNLGSDDVYTVKSLAQNVSFSMKTDNEINYLEYRKEAIHTYSDHTKCTHFFGQITSTPLDIGLQKMSDWVKIHGSRESKSFEAIEITKKLPNSWK